MYTGTFILLLCMYSRSSLTNTCNIALCSSLKTLSCNFLLSSIKTCTENWSTKSLIHLCHNHYCQNPNSTFYVPFKQPAAPHIYSLSSCLVFSWYFLETALVRAFQPLLEMLKVALQILVLISANFGNCLIEPN